MNPTDQPDLDLDVGTPEQLELPVQQHDSSCPLIDLTNCSGNTTRSSYRVGIPVDPGFGSGRFYLASRTSSGWHISSYHGQARPDDVSLLRSYLNGPREVLVTLVRMASVAFKDVKLLERPYTVTDGPDIHDHRAWREWTVREAQKALTEHYDGKVPAGRYYAIAVDTEAGYLQGYGGRWTLGQRGQEITVHQFS